MDKEFQIGDSVSLKGDQIDRRLLTVVSSPVGSEGAPWVTVGWFTTDGEYRTAEVPVASLRK